MGISQNLLTAFHPQTDGQMEHVNQDMETYLRLYSNFNQGNWSALLPYFMYMYNSTLCSSTGKTPFELLLNYIPYLGLVDSVMDNSTIDQKRDEA